MALRFLLRETHEFRRWRLLSPDVSLMMFAGKTISCIRALA